jgi:hypothetical protein
LVASPGRQALSFMFIISTSCSFQPTSQGNRRENTRTAPITTPVRDPEKWFICPQQYDGIPSEASEVDAFRATCCGRSTLASSMGLPLSLQVVANPSRGRHDVRQGQTDLLPAACLKAAIRIDPEPVAPEHSQRVVDQAAVQKRNSEAKPLPRASCQGRSDLKSGRASNLVLAIAS